MKDFDEMIRESFEETPTTPPQLNKQLIAAYAKPKTQRIRKMVVIIPIAATMLCGAGIYVASTEGEFRDIKNMFGAVTGEEYLNASSEISVTAQAEPQGVTVSVTFEKPNEAPYYTFEQIRLTEYQIIRISDGEVMTPEMSASFTYADTKNDPMLLYIPTEEKMESGEYELNISTFEGSSKADQPLSVNGEWHIRFTAE